MRFLVDQPVSPQLVEMLCAAGHDAVHVRELGLSAAKDEAILDRALKESRTVVTQDHDFGTLLAGSGAARPSVIRFRMRDGRAETQVRALLGSLAGIEADLRDGAIVVVQEQRVRIRALPIISHTPPTAGR